MKSVTLVLLALLPAATWASLVEECEMVIGGNASATTWPPPDHKTPLSLL